VSEGFELGDESPGGSFGVAFAEVVAAEVAVGLAGAEHVPVGHEHRVLDGYERSAPLSKAGEIRAPLLLIHGASDDNVHLQNTLAFIDALARARKPYELQIQPREKHGFRGTDSLSFRNQAIVRFFEEHL